MKKLEKMLHDITTNISQILKEVTDCVSEGEQRVVVVENVSTDADQRLLALEKTAREMTKQLHDYENRGRCKNLRIIGLQERLKGINPTMYMESWIPQFLELDTKAGWVKLERAHRLPSPHTSRFPRAMIVRLHNFSDWQRVMDAARRLKDIWQDGARIRKKLQNIEGARYAMIYPASLGITVSDMIKTFHSPEEASAFVDSL